MILFYFLFFLKLKFRRKKKGLIVISGPPLTEEPRVVRPPLKWIGGGQATPKFIEGGATTPKSYCGYPANHNNSTFLIYFFKIF
jgi:hypothetical protein